MEDEPLIYEASSTASVRLELSIRKFILAVGVTFNVAVLFYFKYLVWILSELQTISLFQWISIKEQALPLGISFFTFHAVSYLVDVYKGIIRKHGAVEFASYFFMFPHLVAGPIVRFETVRRDLLHRKFDSLLFAYGAFRFVLGVNKKVLIANSVAPLADLAFFSSSPTLGAIDAWIGILAYTVQIYFDFSGYSDMAIGLAAMMGVRFEENFQSPYRSQSIREFWRRWHISLSTWLRDYLYIPLGGSRCSKWMNYRNLVLVFIICGLWHGAQFTFLIWGLFHGALLIFERTIGNEIIEKTPLLIRRVYCMVMVAVGWVFFRADNLPQAYDYIVCMFSFDMNPATLTTHSWVNLSALVLGLGISLFGREYFRYGNENDKYMPLTLFAVNMVLFVISLCVLYTSHRNPFIYFNF